MSYEDKGMWVNLWCRGDWMNSDDRQDKMHQRRVGPAEGKISWTSVFLTLAAVVHIHSTLQNV